MSQTRHECKPQESKPHPEWPLVRVCECGKAWVPGPIPRMGVWQRVERLDRPT